MKIDLRWGYNNIKIKKGDKWKAVLLMLESVFEPMVMFFRLTNSLAIFQVMMNNLIRNIIEVEDVAVFNNDVMMETQIEEGYNDIMEEILRKMVENNLFIKPKKYVWKVREVRFLGVVIGLDKVKMEKEKVQKIVDQPVLRSIKNIKVFGVGKLL